MSDKLHAPKIKWLVEPRFDGDGVQVTAGIDEFGREHGDPVPLRPPAGLSVSVGDALHDELRKMFARENSAMRAAIEREQFESEEEANDFLVEDELFPVGNEAWEDVFDFPAPVDKREEVLTGRASPDSLVSVETKEEFNVSAKSNEGRVDDGVSRARGGGQKREGKSVSVKDADDGGGVREADRGATRSDE